MGRARASIDLPAQVSASEALWYDLRRWPVFVDGFGHVVKVQGDWPRPGARVVWDSIPAGRGRVVERVIRHEAGSGQAVEVEDPRITGVQTVAFAPRPDGASSVTVELRWQLKGRTPLSPLVDALFVRRAVGGALRRTLARFRRELQADLELSSERS